MPLRVYDENAVLEMKLETVDETNGSILQDTKRTDCRKVLRIGWWMDQLQYFWDKIQVDHRGAYSTGRMQALERYSKTVSYWRVIALCCVTPLPSLCIVLAVECMPLKTPHLGWNADFTYWLRTFITFFVMSHSLIAQAKQVIPELPVTVFQILSIALIGSISYVGFVMLIAATWTFPIPFGFVITSPAYGMILVLCVLLVVGKRSLRMLSNVHVKFKVYAWIIAVQALPVLVYPLYNAVFDELRGIKQTLFVLTPSLFKLGLKNLLQKCSEPAHLDDQLPELMIFTIELFNILYLTSCMQATGGGKLATFSIIIFKSLQMILSMRGVLRRGKHVRKLIRALSKNELRRDRLSTVALGLLRDLGHRSSIAASAKSCSQSTITTIIPSKQQIHSIVPAPRLIVIPPQAAGITDSNDAAIKTMAGGSASKSLLVGETLKTLFNCEYLVLASYVNCMIPTVCLIHTLVLYHLSNQAFFPRMKQYTDTNKLEQAMGNVSYFVIAELITVILLWFLLRRRLGHSIFRQLGSVLEHNYEMIQMRLLTWVTFVLLFPIEHGGNDFTFEFKWMQSSPAT